MLDGLLKSKFQTKCKALLRATKTRVEGFHKKKNAVRKNLTNDIADLLKTGHDYNAYGRAEGLLIEQNAISCYEFVDKFCACVSEHLSAMNKQGECPAECREAVVSLMYAAARFAEFPELRDLRTLFTDKYGTSLESFISKEFVEKLKSKPVTKEMKLQLLHDIAQEFSIEWDSKSLEQKLFRPPPPAQDQARHESQLTSRGKDETRNDEYNRPYSNENVTTVRRRDRIDPDGQWASSSPTGSVSEDEEDTGKPVSYKSIPPPYVRPQEDKSSASVAAAEEINCIVDTVPDAKPKPRSVRRRNLKPPPGLEIVGGADKIEDNKQASIGTNADDEEEEMMDRLLKHYSQKTSHYEMSEGNPNLKPPPSRQNIVENVDEPSGRMRRKNRAASLPQSPTSPPRATKGHARATSLQPDMLAGHVHPKLPDYDELVAQFAAPKR